MHSYFRAVGYSNVRTAPETEKLIKKILADPSTESSTEHAENYPMREYRYECAPGVGIMVRAELDTDPSLESECPVRVLNYFPYLTGSNVTMLSPVYVSKKVDTRAFHGMCDDSRLGISLIFYMLNVVDYLNSRDKDRAGNNVNPDRTVIASALSLEGKVLLPIDPGSVQEDTLIDSLMRPARKHAKDSVNNDAGTESENSRFDIFAEVADRAKREDIFTIVENTFYPYGAESDVYGILGTIEDFRLVNNRDTGEQLCVMDLNCNGILMKLCINREDLIGEPAPGRRFRGVVWVQGFVEY